MPYNEIAEPMSSPKRNLLCNQYKRDFREWRGFRLAALKLIIEYSFPGSYIKVVTNSKEMRFDIYLRKENINLIEVEKFRKFYGKGFHIILLSESDDTL